MKFNKWDEVKYMYGDNIVICDGEGLTEGSFSGWDTKTNQYLRSWNEKSFELAAPDYKFLYEQSQIELTRTQNALKIANELLEIKSQRIELLELQLEEKLYTEKDLLQAREDAFNSASEYEAVPINDIVGIPRLKYPTFNDYMNSITTPKQQ